MKVPVAVGGGLHEHDFEECQAEDAGIVAWSAEEKPLAAQDPPETTPDEKAVQRRRTAQI